MAITYAEILADICLHSTTSVIHKIALLGNNGNEATEHEKIMSVSQSPMKSAGLLDLVHFRAIGEAEDGGYSGVFIVPYCEIQS